jgi:hypothetical protein
MIDESAGNVSSTYSGAPNTSTGNVTVRASRGSNCSVIRDTAHIRSRFPTSNPADAGYDVPQRRSPNSAIVSKGRIWRRDCRGCRGTAQDIPTSEFQEADVKKLRQAPRYRRTTPSRIPICSEPVRFLRSLEAGNASGESFRGPRAIDHIVWFRILLGAPGRCASTHS